MTPPDSIVARWAIILGVFTAVTVGVILAAALRRRLIGPRPRNEVRVDGSATGTGWMCVAAVILFGFAGLAGDVFARGPDQYLSWGGLVGFFALGALYLLILEGRVRVRHSKRGLIWRGRLGGWRTTAWEGVQSVAYSSWSHTLVFKLHDNRQVVISGLSDGFPLLLKAADRAGVAGVAALDTDEIDEMSPDDR